MRGGKMSGNVSEKDVIQNLADAGSDADLIEKFMAYYRQGDEKMELHILEKHRSCILDNLHKAQKEIDCLDYLVYQIRKQGNV